MANNQYVNKVEYAGQTLVDLTGDTVTPSKVLSGETFHDRSGAPQQGSMITHNVYDGLDSTSTDDALSANQGKNLSDARKRTALSSGDFNTLTVAIGEANKYYYGTSIQTITNAPPGITGSFSLDIMDMGGYSVQQLVVYSTSSVRFFQRQQYWSSAKVWGSWKELSVKSDIPAVYDGLDSTSTSDALSAKQGKVLHDSIISLPKTYAGTISCPAVAANAYSTTSVTFTNAMSNTNYAVSLNFSRGTQSGAYRVGVLLIPFAKKTTGFSVMVYSAAAIDANVFEIDWMAVGHNN